MKQVVLRGGVTQVVDVPAPSPEAGRVLVANAASVISSGTERAAVASGGGGGSLPTRAIRNPDLVKKALEHVREHGIRETFDLARGATAPDAALGYSSAGVVLDTGGIGAFRVGQHVACAGAGFACHAEVVSVPGNLVAPVPDGVSLRDAAFTTLGSIALQGVRRTEPTLGERVVVVGLGLLGLLTIQLLEAAGCQVLGVEPVAARRDVAAALGLDRTVTPDDAADAVSAWTGGVGADAVVICASTAGDGVINAAVKLLRRKGRLIPVGDIGFGVDRAPLYVREADILISTSYGPGRYDATYEEAGIDYPISYVRWTENRNMEEFLRLVGTEAVRVSPLVDLEVPHERAGEAYAAINNDPPPLAAVLTYEPATRADRPEVVRVSGARPRSGTAGSVGVAIVGAGGFIGAVHVPNLRNDPRAEVVLVASRTGTTASDMARVVGGADVATDWRVALEDDRVDLVIIGTRHDTHAEIASAALAAGKSVFVEKPLGLSRAEIDSVWAAGRGNDRLAIGFNRPFAPLSQQLLGEVRGAEGPIQVVYRVNAPLAADHWLNDPAVGGGRILGEACHMYDYANWLCGTPIHVFTAALPGGPDARSVETSSTTIEYEGGSVATVHYIAVGGPSMEKERVEVFRGGRSWILDDYRTLTSFAGEQERRVTEVKKVDKGHAALLRGVIDSCLGGEPFAPGLVAAFAAQSVALAALESAATGAVQPVLSPPADGPLAAGSAG